MSSLRWYWNRLKTYLGRPRMVIQDKAVVLTERDRCEHPLFIIGPQRSGTSLVRRMINSHPDIACPPESFFITDYARMAQDPEVLAGYLGFGHDEESARTDLARKASELHEALRIARGKTVWADKTPQYAFQLPAIDALFGGRPRYLMVRRHPWDSAFSIWKRGWRFNGVEDPLESALVHVRDALDRMNSFAAQHPERCASVRYHEVCADPQAAFGPALSHLGLSFHPDMLTFGERTDHNFGTEDPVLRGQRKLVLSEGGWTRWSEERKAMARSVLDPAAYGYASIAGA